MKELKSCCICGKQIKSATKVKDIGYMCQKHQHQWYEKGEITDPTPYSIHDYNEFIDCGDYYKIVLRKASEQYKIVGYALIDKEDYERCKNIRWRLTVHKSSIDYKDVQGGSPTNGTLISLHRFIMNNPKDITIDHINGNTLDNRKSNLRLCFQKDNLKNKTKLLNNNKSGFTGVYRDNKKEHKTNWISEIRVDGTKIYISAHVNLEDAVYSRYVAECLLFKEFRAITNDDAICNIIQKCTNENKIKIKNKVVERIQKRLPDFEIDYNILKTI